ncbi:ATP-grasp peptide maturase system methyltransferase [Streptomyces montanisoli]|uniref:Protein-L-isoaspartate O-methyltransferase n=1 Tax=Streptomyces montanisoli TaxID=2798581 RepID=A0A940RVN8_9ACTN|nr:ATP-grasp peptide maturase system methyltransferase [Streptomyces montanisoli]MBP0458545.1 ATP-grasp peptide maturase system methyltransferase [Streptomyces montanisoli]
MTIDAASLRVRLARRMAESGSLSDPAWRAAIESVPREAFLGQAVFRPCGTAWEPVRRDQVRLDEWLDLAYRDETWVTQVEGIDAASTESSVSGNPTSSSTLPSLIIRMLEVARVESTDRVLEIGTGTGYSTAVLCHRLGAERVTSVECDRSVARHAAASLRATGWSPDLVVGDGLHGYAPGAPYDVLVATCSVRSIPFSWMVQVRAGGTVTTTLSGWMLASGLVRLTLAEDGSASGRFTRDQVSYMLARPHERPPHPAFFQHEGTARECLVPPQELEGWTGRFLAQLAAPSAELMTTEDGLVLWDVATGSQAWTERVSGTWAVHQHGPLRLWDQVEDAITTWKAVGQPDQSAFGLSVTTDHAQYVWIGDPSGPSWPLPV